MRDEHKQSELSFYEEAYKDNQTRRERGYAWEKEPSEVVKGLIKKHKLHENTGSKKALDVGCGDGRHLKLFHDLGFNEVVGVDFSPQSIELCKQRFASAETISMERADITEENPIRTGQEFDLILDWSVLDHILEQYVDQYTKNILDLLSPGGHLIAAEFNHELPGIPEGQNYKIEDGHYSRAYSIEELQETWKPLKLIDSVDGRLEDEINNYKLNTVLLKNTS